MYYAVERSPSFMHAGTGRVIRKHKYLLRVPGPNNSYRYLYTQEEVNAYRNSKTQREAAFKANFNNQVNKVKKAVSDASGLTAKKDNKRLGKLRDELYDKASKLYDSVGKDDEGYKIVSQMGYDIGRDAYKAQEKYRSSALGKVDKLSAKAKKAMHSVHRKVSDASAKVAERQQNAAKAAGATKKYLADTVKRQNNRIDFAKKTVEHDPMFTPGGRYERKLARGIGNGRAEKFSAYSRYMAATNGAGGNTGGNQSRQITRSTGSATASRPHQRKKKVVSGTATVKRR